jgi:hypothetical protein
MEKLEALKLSEEAWVAFKKETTVAESTAMEIIWEVYESRSDIIQGKPEKLQKLAENLKNTVPFEGLEVNDITWEALHATSLTIWVEISNLTI